MANGLSINGVTQPIGFGLGNVVTWAAGEVPLMYMGAVARPRSTVVSGNAALLSLCQGELVPKVGGPAGFAPANTCGIEGSMACSYGSPQSSLSGLGDVSNWVCSSWASIMTQLEMLLARAETMGLTATPEYVGARDYFNNTTGAFDKPIIKCAEHTQAATQFYNALNTRLGTPSPPPLVDSGGPFNFTPQTSDVIKWAAVAVVAVAGAYALGPIFRGIGNLIPSRKR